MSNIIQIIRPKKKKHNFHLQIWRTPPVRKEAQPRIASNIAATRFSQPMVTCQIHRSMISHILMGVHGYDASVRSGASVAAGSDLLHEGDRTKVEASDRAAVSVTVSRA